MDGVNRVTSSSLPLQATRAAVRGAVARVTSRPDVLCWAVAAMGFVYVWRIPVLFATLLAPLRLGVVTTLIALVAWFNVNDAMRRWQRLQRLAPIRLLLALCVVTLAGIPLGIWPGGTLMYIRMVYVGLVLYLLLTVASIRTRADVERIMLMHVVGAAIYCLFVARVSVGVSGRLGHLPSFDANDLAMFLVSTIPLAVYFMRTGSKLAVRVLVGFVLVLFVVILVRTGSRGGFLGFIVTMLYLLFRFKGIPVRIRIAAIALGVVTLSLAGTDKYWALMGTIGNPEEDYNYTESGGRVAIWKRGLGYLAEHPIVGVGMGNFGAAEAWSPRNRARTEAGKGWKTSAPHNSFVQQGVETGLTGLAIFVALLVISIGACSWRAPPNATQAELDEQAIARALAGGLVGYCAAGFFLSQAYSPLLYSLLGLVAGLIKLRKFSPLRVQQAPQVTVHAPARRAPRARIARRRG